MLVCKKCGYKQSDENYIRYMKKKFRHTEEHDIPYYCGACLDNASDEEYCDMCNAMDNPEFNQAVDSIRKDLSTALSYDEWAGREYGEDKVDIDDTAYELAALGYRKDTDIVKEVITQLEEVVDKYPTTIGSFMINKKLKEIKERYGITD